MWMLPEQDPLCTSPNEESGPLANNAPLTLCTDQFLQVRFPFNPCSVHVFVILDCNSLLLTIQFPDALTPEVQQCSLLSSCWFAMSVWIARAVFFCTFSVEACEFVTCEVPDFENATRMLGSRIVLSDKIHFISMCHP